jgi:hypothetical protein
MLQPTAVGIPNVDCGVLSKNMDFQMPDLPSVHSATLDA